MSKYVDNVYLETEECCNCGMAFAMTQEFTSKRVKDHKWFYCPAGHGQHYSGETAETKLKRRLAKAQQDAQHHQQRAIQATSERDASDRRYGRIRDRVKNGVCPCCNRTFENLARHISTKHPNFGNTKTLKVLRDTYGLTQVDLCNELNLPLSYISKYENDKKPIPQYALNAIEAWVDEQ